MPYSESEWQAERDGIVADEEAQGCPSCGWSGFYGPREADDGRQYRMCKFCGFYQGIGEAPKQLRPCAHGCDQVPEILGARYIQWMSPGEETYRCFYCGGEDIEPEATEVAAPIDDTSHPWREVSQGLTYGQYSQFWQGQAGKPLPYLSLTLVS